MPQKNIFDLIIIGAGPAGLAAAIYAARKKIKTLVISLNIGGQAALTHEVENYPGVDLASGFELLNKFKIQAKKFGAEFLTAEVMEILPIKSEFKIKTNREECFAKSLILAFGLSPKKLNVPGEDKLIGRGVTYCATCDGPLYKNKIVAVIGGGNGALADADYLSRIAKKVFVIQFTPEFLGDKYLLDKVKKIKNVEFQCCEKVARIKGEKKLESIILAEADNGAGQRELKIDGLFIEIGNQAKSDWLKGLVELSEAGEVKINRYAQTSRPGIFAAGDCSDNKYKQIVIAAGEGAKAALEAYNFLNHKTAGRGAPDWGKK